MPRNSKTLKTDRKGKKITQLFVASAIMLSLVAPQIQNVFAAGYGNEPTINGTSQAASSVTYNQHTVMTTGCSSATILKDTVFTNSAGTPFNYGGFVFRSINESQPEQVVGGIEFGVPGATLNFSKSIIFSVCVDSKWNGNVMSVYFTTDGGTGWRRINSCEIQQGICTFTAPYSGKFVVSTAEEKKQPAEKAKRDQSGKCLDSSYQSWYSKIKRYKQHNIRRYVRMKRAYNKYRSDKKNPRYAQYKTDYHNFQKYLDYKVLCVKKKK